MTGPTLPPAAASTPANQTVNTVAAVQVSELKPNAVATMMFKVCRLILDKKLALYQMV